MRRLPLSSRDWQLLHKHLIWLVAAMLYSGVALLLSQTYLQYQQNQLRPLQLQFEERRSAADAAQHALLAAQTSQQRYAALVQAGIIGKQEHRLDWVEALTALKRTDALLQFDYSIAAQRPLEQVEAAGQASLYASLMQVKYQALHEGQFSALHQRIRQLPGWAAPRQCEIRRAANTTEAIDTARLQLTCNYEWLSIAPRSAE